MWGADFFCRPPSSGSGWVSVWLNINPWEDEGVCLPPSPVISLLFGWCNARLKATRGCISHMRRRGFNSWVVDAIAAHRLDLMHGIIRGAWSNTLTPLKSPLFSSVSSQQCQTEDEFLLRLWKCTMTHSLLPFSADHRAAAPATDSKMTPVKAVIVAPSFVARADGGAAWPCFHLF